MTKTQKMMIQEILAKFNDRRRLRKRPAVRLGALPTIPRDPFAYYLVDTYRVRRHWRRRPTFNPAFDCV